MRIFVSILGALLIWALSLLAAFVYAVNFGDSLLVGIIIVIIASISQNWWGRFMEVL